MITKNNIRNNKWLFVAPAIIVLASVAIVPLIYAIVISFFKWPKLPINPPTFAGLYNFYKLFKDPTLRISLSVTFKFVGAAILCEIVFGLILALVLNKIHKLRGVIISYLLIPSMLPMVASGVIWLLLFSTYYGPVNHVLSELFSIEPIPWLTSSTWSFVSIVIADVWQWTPFTMIIILSGLVSVPEEIVDAAKVDGASNFQKFFRIILPYISPVLLVAVIIRTVDAFKTFGMPLLMTGGGPGNATKILGLYIYDTGFLHWNFSYAAAISIIYLILIIIIINVYLKVLTIERF